MATFDEVLAASPVVAASPWPKLQRLWDEVQALVAVPGDLAEFGVWRGGSARLLAHLALAQGRTLHLYDTFAGIPASAVESIDAHQAGDFGDTSLEAVQALLVGHAVVYHVGEFDPAMVPAVPLAAVHIDADTYRSYWLALPRFWGLLSPGGVLVLDDPGSPGCRGATEATAEFLATCHPQPVRATVDPVHSGMVLQHP